MSSWPMMLTHAKREVKYTRWITFNLTCQLWFQRVWIDLCKTEATLQLFTSARVTRRLRTSAETFEISFGLPHF